MATNALDVDTRADIYALGVILYELLTGTTPLERKRLAEAAWDEVRRLIREEEPPRPSTRLSSSDALPSVAAQRHIEPAALSKLVRGELDWIAMRALDKDRNRRYATANAFAADVRRYLADEPVEACPPSTAYRLRKFARKHRGSLAAATTLMAVLLAAAGVSLWYADAARRSEVTAIAARNDLATVNDELEGTLARSLGRPLHFDRDLSESESEALWELAQGQARLGLRFLQEAIRTPLTTTQLRWRSEPALIAAIGLDPERRIRASRLVVERLQDQSLDYRQRADIALVGLEITSPEAGSNAAITEALWSALAKEPNEELLNTWSLQFSYRVNCVPPAFAAQILGGAFARGVAFDDDVDLFQLTEGLARVADRLSPGDAALLLADAIARPSAAQVRKVLIDNLASVTNRMSLDEAAQVCRKATRHLADALAREKDDYYRKQLALGLAQLARRLPSVEATELLTDSLAKESNVYARFTLAESLIQFADQMSSEEAGQVRGRFFRLLADALTKENDAHVRKFLAELLARHAGQLPPQQAARQCSDTARLLADALDKATDPSVRLYLAEGLSHVTTKLPPDAAAKVCSDSARLLADTLTKETERNPWSLHLTTAGLALLAARLPQDEADRICGDAARFLAGALVKQTHASNRRRLVHAMKHLTARMSGNDAVLLLTDTLTKENDPYTLRLLVEGLVTNTGRHTASEVERLCSEVAAKSWDKNSWFERELAIGSLLTQVSLTDAQPRARYHAFRVAADERANSFDPTDQSTTGVTALDRLLTATSPTTVKQRSAAAMVAISQGAAGPLAVLPALPTAAEPPPCRLTTQELVDLLKMPTLYGEARKVVLKHLGNRYGRRFPDHWAFVRYATEQKLGLDFTTPPKRPPAVQ